MPVTLEPYVPDRHDEASVAELIFQSDPEMNRITEVENLVKSFGDFEAVKGVSFSVEEGEVFGLLGPNGAGKTLPTWGL